MLSALKKYQNGKEPKFHYHLFTKVIYAQFLTFKKKIPCARPFVERTLCVHCNISPLTRFQFNAFLKKTTLTINHTFSTNKTHSFRIGGETCHTLKWVSHENPITRAMEIKRIPEVYQK